MKEQIIFITNISEIHMTGIYKLYFQNAPDDFYIGSASSIQRAGGFYLRMYKHVYALKNNTHHSKIMQGLFNSGHNLVMQIIELCDPSKCLDREDFYLKTLDPLFNSTNCAFNSTGFRHSKESKLKMSIDRKGKRLTAEHSTAISNSLKGKTPKNISLLSSPDIRKKVSDKLKGRPQVAPERLAALIIPVAQVDRAGVKIKIFDSIKYASIETGIDGSSIGRCVSGKRMSAGGFVWESIEKGYSISRHKKPAA